MKAIFLVSFMLCALFSFTQKGNESFYVFDKDWKGTTVDKAVYMIYVQQVNDTAWQWNYYNYLGPLLNIETFRYEKSDTAHGYFAWFNKEGKIDSSGTFYSGAKNGTWYYYGDSINPQSSKTFEYGRLVKEWKKYESKNNDSLPEFKEAVFKSGLTEWKKYISKNFTITDRAMNNRLKGEIKIYFAVLENGKTGDIRIIKSSEFSMDQEAIKLIRNSPAWRPATENSNPVKSWHVQPLTFIVAEN